MSSEEAKKEGEEDSPHQQFAKFIFGINWLDPFSPSKASTRGNEQKTERAGGRRLYFGAPSLVPEDYKPPPHPIVWDGTVAKDRKVHVRNFHRHFACFQGTDLNEKIVDSLESIGEYRKPLWYSAVLASAAPIMFEHEIAFTREELVDRDGGIITIDWVFPPGHQPPSAGPHQQQEQQESQEQQPLQPQEPQPQAQPQAQPQPQPQEGGGSGACSDDEIPTVVIFPGLAGHSAKDYIRSIAGRLCSRLGARICVLNWRGFNCKLTGPKVFRPDDISDMEAVIENVHKMYPKSPVFAIGYSAGSNQLVKYLGMHKGEHPVVAAVSVCNGFEYEPHIRRIEGSAFGEAVYSRGMTFLHQEYLRVHGEKLAELVEGFDLQQALNASKHTELDEVLVKTLYGYEDLKEYYASVASRPFISGVSVPLLCIQVLPVEDLYNNNNIIYFETEYGAHLSFVEATFQNGVVREEYTFADRAIEAYLRAVAPAVWSRPGGPAGAGPKQ